jgi:hypothetical protein
MSTATRHKLLAVIACATVFGAPAVASAATTVTGTVTGGALSITPPPTAAFSDNLASGDQTQTYPLAIAANDLRGTGAGWNLTVTSTQFTSGSNTLAANASAISTAPTSACATGTCTATGGGSLTYPVAVPAGVGPPTAVKFFSTTGTSGGGMGQFTITPSISVFVPGNSYAGSYASTVTLAAVTGP